MTQEERQLLFKDLCERLPYGVIIHADEINIVGELIVINIPYNIVSIRIDEQFSQYTPAPIVDVKPYLRPMSSMTEKEKYEYHNICVCPINKPWDVTDWLNKKGFDYRGLIKKGLALEAPEGMYKTE